MLNIKNIKPNDLYKNGKDEYVVIGIWYEPVIKMKNLTTGETIMGGYSGLMWKNFKLEAKGGD